MFQRFEIHSHSDFSNIRLLDSINKVETLIKTADKCGLSGISLTDHETVAGTIQFYQTWKELVTPDKEGKTKINPNFKIACGNEIYLIDSRNKDAISRYFHFILLAKNNFGHQALRELSSNSWYHSFTDRGMERVPTLKSELEDIVRRYPNTLIASSACLGSELGYYISKLYSSQGQELYDVTIESCIDFINWCKSLFHDDFYLEIAPSFNDIQIFYNQMIIKLAEMTNTKVVIGTDAHYATQKEASIHEAYLNSKEGDREVRAFYSSAYIMSNDEVWEYIKEYIPLEQFEAICGNSIEIMGKIEGYNFSHSPIIPIEEVPNYPKDPYDKHFEQYEYIQKYLDSENEQDRAWINTCLEAAKERNRLNEKNLSRINKEADIQMYISKKLEEPLSAYHNTMRHYINLFWECGSIVGPGRGSACGWLTNMLLGITQIDPLRWGLNEWRYLNKERVELGDIDIDLAPSKRALIFKKIREKKGELNLIQVCTFGTEGTRSAILTACRGYRSDEFPEGIDVDIAQYLSGMIAQERGFLWDIQDVLVGNEEKGRKPNQTFITEVGKYPGLLDIIVGITGLINKRSQHASGVILYNTNPYETNAVMRSPNGDLITQYSLHDAEYVGDVKFDFLVTEISDKIIYCLDLLQKDGLVEKDFTLRQLYDKYLHPENINLDDKRIWEALAEGNIIDVFQFNSEVGLQAAKAIKPTNPFEMTAANALNTMGAKHFTLLSKGVA
jgi:DNA polymerase III subunit alpha